MSTILEMAEIVRAGGFPVESKPVESGSIGRVAEVFTKDRINDLCNLFDTTPWGLCCAIESVGSDPRAIGRFLRQRKATRDRSAVAID
jgi:hypothetical protein